MSFTGYYSGQGKAYIAARIAGVMQALRWLGDVNELKIGESVEKEAIKESWSGQRSTAKELIKGKGGTFAFNMRNFQRKNCAFGLWGTDSAVTGSTVTGEAMPNMAVGDINFTKYVDVSSLVITDSAGSPVTLTLGTHYRINSAKAGEIEILSLGALTQPFLKAYTYAAHEKIVAFNAAQPEFSLMFSGLNTAEGNLVSRLELYKCNSDPLKEFALISDSAASMQIDGAWLIDDYRSSSDADGQFGKLLLAA